jgi:hypothetical protein
LTLKAACGIKNHQQGDRQMTTILEAIGAVTLFGIATFFLLFVV